MIYSQQLNAAFFVPHRAGSLLAVEIAISRLDRVFITIYNPVGREISSPVDRQLDAGSYAYSWDTRVFARGRYAIRKAASRCPYLYNTHSDCALIFSAPYPLPFTIVNIFK